MESLLKNMVLQGRKLIQQYHSESEDKSIELNSDIKKLGFNSIAEYHKYHVELYYEENYQEYLSSDVYILRKDLDLIGQPRELNGASIVAVPYGVDLVIDGNHVMDTSIREHMIAAKIAKSCPDNASIFIGGLGLGLILLYLEEFVNNINDILIYEVDNRVISLLEKNIADYFNLSITIVNHDAKNLGNIEKNFDFIYFDLYGYPVHTFRDIALSHLKKNGVYIDFMEHLHG